MAIQNSFNKIKIIIIQKKNLHVNILNLYQDFLNQLKTKLTILTYEKVFQKTSKLRKLKLIFPFKLSKIIVNKQVRFIFTTADLY